MVMARHATITLTAILEVYKSSITPAAVSHRWHNYPKYLPVQAGGRQSTCYLSASHCGDLNPPGLFSRYYLHPDGQGSIEERMSRSLTYAYTPVRLSGNRQAF